MAFTAQFRNLALVRAASPPALYLMTQRGFDEVPVNHSPAL